LLFTGETPQQQQQQQQQQREHQSERNGELIKFVVESVVY